MAKPISFKEAEKIYMDEKMPLSRLLRAANEIRERFKKNKVELCSIVNAKSGNCSEDCRFCAQSARHKTGIKKYPLLGEKEILKAAEGARKNGASCFGIVASGRGIKSEKEILSICGAIRAIKGKIPGLMISVSPGIINKKFMAELKKAGAGRFHHNLETSENYFPKMCTTHTYKDRLRTIKEAKAAGFKLCSGGLFGIGESGADRLRLAFALRDLGIDSVPLNFLHPVKGTPLEKAPPLGVDEILRTIAIFRIILPRADIKVCGGRVVNLGSAQSLMFYAGASGMMIGNYLTQPGQPPARDLRMLRDLGLRV